MKRKINLLFCFVVFGIFISCNKKNEAEKIPYYNSPDFMPHWLDTREEVEKEITHHIGNFSFTDQENKRITQETVKGKIHVANFFFTTCPSICPKMTIQFENIQKAFAKDSNLVLLSFSVTPWIDSTERLKTYADFYHIDPKQWHLLTGEKSKIYELARKSYFAEEEIGFTKDSTEFLHTEHFILVDTSGRIRGIYNGTLELETERLIGDIKNLLSE
ncbi:MAG TPA: SCO family protein [Cytophagaceae bacterium]|nr:SCO family protein [Cytophagaceae bacterium]